MKNLKFFVIIFLDELGLLLSILGFFKDFLEISLISLISANLPLPKSSTTTKKAQIKPIIGGIGTYYTFNTFISSAQGQSFSLKSRRKKTFFGQVSCQTLLKLFGQAKVPSPQDVAQNLLQALSVSHQKPILKILYGIGIKYYLGDSSWQLHCIVPQ